MRNWGNSRELRRLRANGRTKEFFDAPIRVICVIRGYFPSFSSRYFLKIALGINA